MRAGFGSSDITPRPGVQLAGYGPYRNRAARRITVPLLARAMVLTDRGQRTALINLELCVVPRELAQRIRETVARRIRTSEDRVFVTVTHTHSGPAVGGLVGWGEADAMYVETLPSRVAAAAERAAASQVTVEWRYAEMPCEGIAINRETDNGGWMTEPLETRLDPAWRPARPQDTDPTVRVLAAYSRGKLCGVLHHFGCHPVVGSEQTFDVHGDFVGLASGAIERRHNGAIAIFLPGALGDINPPVVHRGPVETRRGLRVIANKYTVAIRRALKTAQPIAVEDVQSLQLPVRFTRAAWTRARVLRRIAQLEKIFAAPGITDITRVGTPPLNTNGLHMARLEGLRKVLAGFKGGRTPNPPVALHGIRIGPVALLGVGLEVFHSLQASVLQGSPHPRTWIVSLAGGGSGYAPDRRAHAKKGYTDELVPLLVGEVPFKRIYSELPREMIRLAQALA